MAILKEHIPYYLDIFQIENFLNDPIVIFGFQDCIYKDTTSLKSIIKNKIKLNLEFLRKNRSFKGATYRKINNVPNNFKSNNLQGVLKKYGLKNIKTIDCFDKRADYQLDMNKILPEDLKEQFNTVIDVGCIEHVFDTKQAIENIFNLVKKNGFLLLHTVCSGYFNHGFHTFSPECLIQALKINGFSINYLKYSTPTGIEIENPGTVWDALIWIVAKKESSYVDFQNPQQNIWKTFYK